MKSGVVKNPLTLISIFAGLSETAGTVVLPMLPIELQRILIWYVVGLPILLVGLFFYVLIWKTDVLYAPGDFTSDDGYMNAIKFAVESRRKTSVIVEREFGKINDVVQRAPVDSELRREVSSQIVQSKMEINESLIINVHDLRSMPPVGKAFTDFIMRKIDEEGKVAFSTLQSYLSITSAGLLHHIKVMEAARLIYTKQIQDDIIVYPGPGYTSNPMVHKKES